MYSPVHLKRNKKGGLVKGSLLKAQQKLTSSRTSLLSDTRGGAGKGRSGRDDDSSSSTCVTPDLLDSSPDAPTYTQANKKPLYTEIGSNNIPLSTTTRPSSLFGPRKSKGTNTSAVPPKSKEAPSVERTRQKRYQRHQKARSYCGGVLQGAGVGLTLSSASETCSSPALVRRVSKKKLFCFT